MIRFFGGEPCQLTSMPIFSMLTTATSVGLRTDTSQECIAATISHYVPVNLSTLQTWTQEHNLNRTPRLVQSDWRICKSNRRLLVWNRHWAKLQHCAGRTEYLHNCLAFFLDGFSLFIIHASLYTYYDYDAKLHLSPLAFGQCSITVRRRIRHFVIQWNTSVNSITVCLICKTNWTRVRQWSLWFQHCAKRSASPKLFRWLYVPFVIVHNVSFIYR